MSIPVNIEDLINLKVVESTRVEFKSDFNPNAIVHTVCAFANDIDNIGGGYIVIGVEEQNGSPVFPIKGIAQERVDGILKRFVGLCHNIEPLCEPVVEPVLFEGVYVIVVWVPGGSSRPYKASRDVLTDKSSKHYYIRKFSSTVVASAQEEKELFYVSTDIPFDDRPCLIAQPEDLDLGLMREHLHEIGSSLYEQSKAASLEEVADDLRLLDGPPEARHPKNVGILMFSEDPQRFFRYARIEFVDLPDPTGNGMVERVFIGPIQRQLRDALSFIENYAIATKLFKHNDRAEATVVYNYPFRAIEEILSNAVYHRSYQIAEPITVRMTLTGIEITSFPGFDRSITDLNIANRKFRARAYRNRRIGDFLKELHLIEGRNTGFPNAFAALEQNGSPEPIFEMDDARGFLSITIPVHPAFLPSGKAAMKAAEFEGAILKVLGDRPLSLTEVATAMGYKGITKRLSTTVETLVSTGKIEQVTVPGSNRAKLSLPK